MDKSITLDEATTASNSGELQPGQLYIVEGHTDTGETARFGSCDLELSRGLTVCDKVNQYEFVVRPVRLADGTVTLKVEAGDVIDLFEEEMQFEARICLQDPGRLDWLKKTSPEVGARVEEILAEESVP